MRSLQHCNCTVARMATPSGGNNQNPNKRLHVHLQSMKAVSTAAPSTETLRTSAVQNSTTTTTTAAAAPAKSDDSLLTKDELATLSLTQQAFVIRKRKYQLGLGPLFSAESQCTTCEGTGSVCCHQCEGTGFNQEHKHGMFDDERGVRIQNGVINVSYFFMQNGPCWLCTAKKVIACAECSGTGLKGGLEGYICD